MAPSTPADAIAFLESLPPSRIRLGLANVQVALNALGNPERRFVALHVAGTNGKGSTCAFAASVLHRAGYKVGLYTSPHLIRFNERIRIGATDISDATLGTRILEVLERYPECAQAPFPLTYFELGTVVAFWHFAQEQVDLAVVETGLGGRLDATVVSSAQVTALTPISFDHMEYLGNTLSAIATEKAGILRAGVPAVSSRQSPEALEVIERRAAALQVPCYLAGRDFALNPSGDGWDWQGIKSQQTGLKLGLRGAHQAENAAVALACLELLAQAGFPVSPQALREGLSQVDWPGRLQELAQNPTLLVDGAHNVAGVAVLLEALDALYPQRHLHGVFGVLADKDHLPMIEKLFPKLRSAHLCPLPSPRSLGPEKYAVAAKQLCSKVVLTDSVEEAVRGARQAAQGDDVVVCTGSLHLVGAVKALAASFS